jgi:uncharacterized membrane protein YsdA (DUF1294 family)
MGLALWLTTELCPYVHLLGIAWAVAINAATLTLFLFDKLVAQWNLPCLRVPEFTFAVFMLLMGSPAVAVGVYVLRHKSSKESFLRILRITFILQFSLFCLIVYLYTADVTHFPAAAILFAKCKT